ncbi:MAG: hypothetical protein OEV91_09810 [Desulfobulbaceae bacterium]|nr:hypothetical protein [Desulfobulbaceae bacterium]
MKKTVVKACLLVAAILVAAPVKAKRLHEEKWYQDQWCARQRGQVEVVLADRTRCDCLTSTNAVEFDFGAKWAEAIGQALYYSLQTGKRAGVVLILEAPADRKYWLRLNSIIEHGNLPIDTWAIGNGVR